MRFLVDAQLPPALARRLVERGHEAEHVADCGLADAAGGAIGRHAEAIGATIVTEEEDFATWKRPRDGGPRVVRVRLRNTRRRDLLAWFDVILPDLLQALERGEAFVEIARDPARQRGRR